jgi:hypothetical protein
MDANIESACAEILCHEYQFACHVTIPQPTIDEIANSAANIYLSNYCQWQ